ncbi:transcription factor bHLH112-like [Bidens hawaiensis]|uniref:transcription factor bHLH112-like n=1 Tax=Bidens hawaiensis TaxID=980011 RepID=UPI00404B39B4
MAEEFPAAIYGGSWWLSPRTACNFSSYSSDIADVENLVPLCLKDCVDMKSKSSDESSDGSMAIQDIQKPGGCNAAMSPDSAFEMMATVFSDLVDWNQNLSSRVQEEMNTFSTSGDDDLKAEHQAFAAGSDAFTTFPINSYGYTSSLVQSLLDSNYSPPPSSPPLFGFQSNSNNLNIAHLTNNTPFLSASSSLLTHNISSTQFLSSSYKEHNHQESWDLGSLAKKGPDELPFKRPRLETPSPLPTFKVRKEKLGDRITALQQLVSPFGKTDTASVLHEAIEYIKLLHDQVNILRAPYMKGATNQLQPIRGLDKAKEEQKRDLRSVGLCLVPVSSTFPVATEMSTGFWTPS